MQNSDHQHETLLFDELFDANDFVPGRTCNNTSSPKLPPLSSNGGGLFPKGSIGKPRRSRAAKRAPTTLLTADATNFRALVQQFTGCHSGPPTRKGPINLSFEQYNCNSEKPEARWSMNEESDQSLVSFRGSDVGSAIKEGELFVSRFNQDPRPDPLTFDDFESFSLQEISSSGPGEDYSAALLPGDDLWGF